MASSLSNHHRQDCALPQTHVWRRSMLIRYFNSDWLDMSPKRGTTKAAGRILLDCYKFTAIKSVNTNVLCASGRAPPKAIEDN